MAYLQYWIKGDGYWIASSPSEINFLTSQGMTLTIMITEV